MSAGFRNVGLSAAAVLLIVPAIVVVALCMPFIGVLNRRALK